MFESERKLKDDNDSLKKMLKSIIRSALPFVNCDETLCYPFDGITHHIVYLRHSIIRAKELLEKI